MKKELLTKIYENPSLKLYRKDRVSDEIGQLKGSIRHVHKKVYRAALMCNDLCVQGKEWLEMYEDSVAHLRFAAGLNDYFVMACIANDLGIKYVYDIGCDTGLQGALFKEFGIQYYGIDKSKQKEITKYFFPDLKIDQKEYPFEIAGKKQGMLISRLSIGVFPDLSKKEISQQIYHDFDCALIDSCHKDFCRQMEEYFCVEVIDESGLYLFYKDEKKEKTDQVCADLISKYDGKILSEEEFEFLDEHEAVKSIDNLGFSGFHVNHIWYSVELNNGSNMDVYMKFAE